MASRPELESTLTDRYQTTVPSAVRRALKLGKRDKVRYQLQADGSVLLTRVAPPTQDDPVLGQFLDFLARDMARRPQGLRALSPGLRQRIAALTQGVEVNLDTPLPPDET